jgi:hypothetical protein
MFPLLWFRRHPWLSSTLGIGFFLWSTHEFLNWRAERRWQHYATEARARGVKLLLTEFATPEIPDAENFAALPMLRAVFAGTGPIPFQVPKSALYSDPSNPIKGLRTDWKVVQQAFQNSGLITAPSDEPIRDILGALEGHTNEINQWREWRTRPRCRFPLDLAAGAEMPFPHFSALMSAGQFFRLRARAHLALGDSEAAYEDFQDGFQTYRAIAEDPTLISGLVRIAMLATLQPALGEGLRDQVWTDVDLQKIEGDLAKIRIWDDFELALASERGFANSTYDGLVLASPVQRARDVAKWVASPFSAAPAAASSLGVLIPRRLLRDNQLRQNQVFDELLARAASPEHGVVRTEPVPSSAERITDPVARIYYFLLRQSSPAFERVAKSYAAVAVSIDEARFALALERHRLKHGTYPETLTALTPDFLPSQPLDPRSGQAYLYRRTDAGSFLLYSVGENRVDDGGKIDPKLSERSQLDAIWLYAPERP